MKSNANKTEQVKNEVTVVELTSNENKVLNALVSLLSAEPGFSDIDTADLAKATKMKIDSVKGVVGSLVKKDLVFTAQTDTFGAPQFELIYLSPMAWSIHPNWKEESEFELEIKVNDSNVKAPTKTIRKTPVKTISKKTPAEKKTPVKTAPVASKTTPKVEVETTVKSLNNAKEEEFNDAKNKPYSVHGLHGNNKDLEGFKKGDKIIFNIKGRGDVEGEYTHLHINNWSPKGYVVIKFEGKIYERVTSKVSKPVVAEKPAPAKKRVSNKTKVIVAKLPAAKTTAKKAK